MAPVYKDGAPRVKMSKIEGLEIQLLKDTIITNWVVFGSEIKLVKAAES